MVSNDPYTPIWYGANVAGMQAPQHIDSVKARTALARILALKNSAVHCVRQLTEVEGLHKQHANRYLEPWLWVTAILTATEWDNFFWQRCHPAAQPEMKALADAIQMVYYTSTPQELKPGEYHLPYVTNAEIGMWNVDPVNLLDLRQVSTARCARVSYLNHDQTAPDMRKDVDLFDKLLGSGHWSPFEHVATPCDCPIDTREDCRKQGNLRGYHQYRKEFKDENRRHFLPNLPELAHIRDAMVTKHVGQFVQPEGCDKAKEAAKGCVTNFGNNSEPCPVCGSHLFYCGCQERGI